MIVMQDVTVRYAANDSVYEAVRGINLTLAAGETCALIGPSGCGKSTILKVLAGLITDYSGQVEVAGEPVAPARQRIGFIPQNYGLLPWKNVYDNICLASRIKGGEPPAATVAALLQQLGLTGLEQRYPGELSGGQQQRVALARSFLLQPDLLLMDEPFSALDAITREEIQDLFLKVWQTHAVSTVLVTHYVEEAVYLGQKIVMLAGTPGTVSKVLDNPLFGQENIRSKPEFFELSLALRKMIKEDWSD